EFVSCAPAKEAREWLEQPAQVIAALEQRLSERNSPYAAIFHALLVLADTKPDATALAELHDEAEEGSIDEEWEDAPVDFSAPIHAGGPTGLIAKIRAARRKVADAKA